MKNLVWSFLVAVVISQSSPAFAQGPGWTVASSVVEIVTVVDGGVNVRLYPELSGCVSNSGYGSIYASIYPSHPGINRIKADLMAAFLMNKKVNLYLSNSSCTVTEVILKN